MKARVGEERGDCKSEPLHYLEVPLGQDLCSLLPLYHHSFIHLLHKYLSSASGEGSIVLGRGKMLNMVDKVPVLTQFIISWAFHYIAK